MPAFEEQEFNTYFSKSRQIHYLNKKLVKNIQIKVKNMSTLTHVFTLAGMEGFEPPNGGTRTRCLTTWRHPNTFQLYQKK